MGRELSCIPCYLAIALFLFGGALLIYQVATKDALPPELKKQADFVSSGNETACVFQAGSSLDSLPTCRVEGSHSKYVTNELLCFCPVRVVAASGVNRSASVYLWTNEAIDRNQAAWCGKELAGPWPNIIIHGNPGEPSHWSCNLIVDELAEPCSTMAGNMKTCYDKGHTEKSKREHYKCLEQISTAAPSPCVALEDGRIVLGTKSALKGQLEEHLETYSTHDMVTLVIGSSLCGGGVFLVLISIILKVCSGGSSTRGLKSMEDPSDSED
eukprot:gnl/TRDRNA2_/TRDRNA2_70235_c0_seq1.p1 gnl/TRDRNA2_/TRDRNA2_70235_c0~~gnl/TRDRNA2_/TRDRNA2_70235_c0_seq1.p1  ORF type:complete len:290 (+),score=26.88 gnl/TRDRNA2_/TRDRNA2_70235_c0_seq1:62-871(+)